MPRPSRVSALLVALTAAGGVADHATLVTASSRGALVRALADGLVIRVGYGRYALAGLVPDGEEQVRSRAWSRWCEGPNEAEQRVLAGRFAQAKGARAALSHLCAAAHHGWAVLNDPDALELAVPLGREVPKRNGVRWSRAALTADELHDHVTSPLRTVIACARTLPTAEALAVADSALRAEMVGVVELRHAGAADRRAGAARVRVITEAADIGAANPFESALRAALVGVPGLNLSTQFEIADDGFAARVDLADPRLRLVMEADSYEFHGSVGAFAKDRTRYTELTSRGWTVLPFGFRDVMDRPEWVRSTVTGAVIGRTRPAALGA